MKVLQIIDQLNVGGAERVFLDLTRSLYKSKKIEIAILTFNKNGDFYKLLDPKINKIEFERKNKFNIFTAYTLSKKIRNFDIIHVHMRHVYKYVKFVSLIFGVKTKIILQDHYGKISTDKKIPKYFNSILKPIFYIGVSEELVNWAKEKLKINNVYKLGNIVIKKEFSPLQKTKKGYVIVGNIKPVKNQLFAIQLAITMNEELTIVGKIQDYEYYESLVLEINKLNYQEKIYFIHNINNVQHLLNKYKLGLMTSISESGPLVLIEYLSQNLPFVAFNTGEVSLTLNKQLPNFFVNDFNKKKWIEKVNQLKKNDVNLESIYDQYFSLNSYVNKCLQIYQKIINY